ncbi:MAG TPA: 4'-phosphopantetheinyl transferase superfamily protein [Candidatus Dormibacteraeota bacterium]|nr:4'-phosphopantetheinyl transferase superfamily protein [Candidatus Dormibacteraeota bacterium]
MRESTWVMVSATDVPADDHWLGPRERRTQDAFGFERRRADWRAGRWAAKQALVKSGAAQCGAMLANLEILSAADGSPELWIGDQRADLALSISHRAGAAAALVCSGGKLAGCDLEVVEPRPQAFAVEWFTANELAAVGRESQASRDRLVTLIWSAKESALKAVRTGLRVDTRNVEISSGATEFVALIHERKLPGWWRIEGNWLMTAVVADATASVEERMKC